MAGLRGHGALRVGYGLCATFACASLAIAAHIPFGSDPLPSLRGWKQETAFASTSFLPSLRTGAGSKTLCAGRVCPAPVAPTSRNGRAYLRPGQFDSASPEDMRASIAASPRQRIF